MARRTQARRRGSRAYRAAPPLTRSGMDPEGAEIIREVGGAAGIALAGSLRDLMLWIETDRAARERLFEADASARRAGTTALADLDPPLWAPVVTLALLTEDPSGADPHRLAGACRRLAEWAEVRGSPATRLAFVQAAALLHPRDAHLALEVARLARELGERGRAESWFRHAVRLTRNRDWEAYVWAYVGLGVLYIRSGNLPAANVVFLRALRTADRHGLAALAGVAHHHLFHLDAEAGRIADAYHHVRTALDCYGRSHPRLPHLAWDVGRFWLHIGQGGRAIPLFERVLRVLDDPNERALLSANSTWAAAAAGDAELYTSFRSRTLGLMADAAGPARTDEAFAALAYADLEAGAWSRAAEAAAAARERAAATGNAEVRTRAAALLGRARAGLADALRPPSPVEAEPLVALAETLADELLGVMASRAG